MYLEVNLPYEKTQVLLVGRVLHTLLQATHIAAPLVRQREVVAEDVDVLSHLLRHRAYYNGNADLGAFDSLDLEHLLRLVWLHVARHVESRHTHRFVPV